MIGLANLYGIHFIATSLPKISILGQPWVSLGGARMVSSRPRCHNASSVLFSSVQSLSRVRLFVTPWTAAHQTSLSSTISQSLLKLMSSGRWCHPTISSSFVPFSSCPQSFPASGSFPVSGVLHIRWSTYWSFSFNISLSVNIQDWFPLGLTGLISLQSKGLSRVFCTTIWKHQFFRTQPSLWPNSHIFTWLLEIP